MSIVQKGINISWVKRLVLEYNTWSSLLTINLKFEVNTDNLKYLFRANLSHLDVNQCFKLSEDNPWWDILQDWCTFNYHKPEFILYKEDILWQTLWFNSCIKIEG